LQGDRRGAAIDDSGTSDTGRVDGASPPTNAERCSVSGSAESGTVDSGAGRLRALD